MSERPDAIAYTETAQRVLANQLQVEADGSAWYVSQFSKPGMPARALGVFHTTFPPKEARVEGVFEFAAMKDLVRLETPQTIGREPPPKSILINKGDVTKAFNSDLEGVFISPLNELELLLQKVISGLGPFPITALGFSTNLSTREFRSGDFAKIQFEFKNLGGSKVGFANPRYTSEEVEGQISIEIWQGPPEQGAELILTLSSHDHELLKAPRQALSSGTPILEIQPAESLGLFLEFKVPKLKPGDCVIRSSYSSACEPPQKGVVTGVYAADLAPLHILPILKK